MGAAIYPIMMRGFVFTWHGRLVTCGSDKVTSRAYPGLKDLGKYLLYDLLLTSVSPSAPDRTTDNAVAKGRGLYGTQGHVHEFAPARMTARVWSFTKAGNFNRIRLTSLAASRVACGRRPCPLRTTHAACQTISQSEGMMASLTLDNRNFCIDGNTSICVCEKLFSIINFTHLAPSP